MTGFSLGLIGMNGNCVEIIEAISENYLVCGIFDEDTNYKDTTFEHIPILPTNRIKDFPDAQFLLLVGSQTSIAKRPGILERLGLPRERFAKFIHSSASVSAFARLGCGTVVYEGALITSNAQIGDHVLILPRSIIHHDVTIGDHSIIGSGVIIAGGVRIGNGCYVGSGAAIKNGISVGDGAVIGMGSVVVHDVAAGRVVAGNPARPIR